MKKGCNSNLYSLPRHVILEFGKFIRAEIGQPEQCDGNNTHDKRLNDKGYDITAYIPDAEIARSITDYGYQHVSDLLQPVFLLHVFEQFIGKYPGFIPDIRKQMAYGSSQEYSGNTEEFAKNY